MINNDDCYFHIDSIFEGDVSTSNVNTFDTQTKSIESTKSFSVTNDASFSSSINVEGKTSASGLNITSTATQAKLGSINLNGNRLSNVAPPQHDSSPVPANYIRTPEYFFCSLSAGARLTTTKNGTVGILGEDRLIYQSQDILSHIQIVDYSSTDNTVKKGLSALQLLTKGTYIIDCGITKRWGWNNGWGGTIFLEDLEETIYSASSVYSGGGYAERCGLATVIQLTKNNENTSGTLNEEGKKNIIRLRLKGGLFISTSFYFNVIFYPDRN
ncbi:hypothetical protein BOKEGFJH_00320 [Chlamydia avium]|uniref:Uncharacterized protein n=1 Tax=Chlamydia avium TaxID=1457141 RepID=A0ABP2X5Y8_9CHLA|nr:hypothetical protein [Chlamydia avium]EPP38214.1 hypothetical protein CP10881SC42_0737 [Chlamydia avium]VVT42804.1 hypothetical protein BOKEGFJH_00320 [Chlamydia avium]